MGLLNTRNLKKAKDLLEKNRHKVGDLVDKAGTQIDKVSGGKTANVTSKAKDAAQKYSAGGVQHHGIDTPEHTSAQVDPAEANAASLAATNAITNAANAAANLMNNAAVQAQIAQAQQEQEKEHEKGSS